MKKHWNFNISIATTSTFEKLKEIKTNPNQNSTQKKKNILVSFPQCPWNVSVQFSIKHLFIFSDAFLDGVVELLQNRIPETIHKISWGAAMRLIDCESQVQEEFLSRDLSWRCPAPNFYEVLFSVSELK